MCYQLIIKHIPLQRIARLKPRASAVFEFIFSTTLCFTFFRTEDKKTQMYQFNQTREFLYILELTNIIQFSS